MDLQLSQLSQSSESTDDSTDSKTVAIASASGSRKRRATRNELNDDEYKRRRERNNEAVRKCRIKSREKSREMAEKVNFLREENAILSQKVQILSKELTLLKELFLTQAKGPNSKNTLVSNVISHAKEAAPDATVPQSGDHEYHRQADTKAAVIKLEEVESEDDEPEKTSIVDLSVKRPGIVFDRADN